ncbi:ThiF family adenylyltransferase [Candidatus Uhrbacteria bacterium]|nr:ThiF family adenylyltransferase [Candidatus Uhrbacteria bacterium]
MQVTIIGLGGTGTWVVHPVATWLVSQKKPSTRLTLVDGDAYEEGNRDRQFFRYPGNKATSKARELGEQLPALRVEALPEFCNPENIPFICGEGEIVLLCVDNHPTRKLVSEFVQANCRDIAVISVGNELEYGTVLVYVRRGGVDVTPPLHALEEIAHPQGKAPYEMSCEERAAAGDPQILPMNVAAASACMSAFWKFVTAPESFGIEPQSADAKQMRAYTRVDFDIRAHTARARVLPVAPASTPPVATSGASQEQEAAA